MLSGKVLLEAMTCTIEMMIMEFPVTHTDTSRIPPVQDVNAQNTVDTEHPDYLSMIDHRYLHDRTRDVEVQNIALKTREHPHYLSMTDHGSREPNRQIPSSQHHKNA